MRRGVNAESSPSAMDISRDTNMKKALTRSAFPTLVDMAFTLIIAVPFLPQSFQTVLELKIFLNKFRNSCVYV